MAKYLIAFLLLFSSITYGNNLQIGSVTLSNVGNSQYLNFTISWQNSWRVVSNPGNWDAVWLFVKRGDCASLQWRHANLSNVDTDHSGGSPLFVDAYADKKGVMVYRSATGSGNVSNVNIQLKLDSAYAGSYDYHVYGVEMVYIPQGPFYVGDGFSVNSFLKWPNNNPYFISSEDSIAIGQDTGKLYNINSSNPNTGLVAGTTLSAAYPKGYNSFYVMKYEISQGQYADFLNNITQDAAYNRYLSGYSGIQRYTLQGLWPQFTCTAPDRACNFLSFQDLAALLDWSALSPMTEFEFEKACRGPNNSVAVEMAWGGNMVTDANAIAPGTNGTSGEYVTDSIITGTGLANYATGVDSFYGPLRCGFAARTNSNRFQAGATYYGAMEMSGNVWERCYNVAIYNDGVTIGGGMFIGSHGDGELTSTPNAGYANAGWPKAGLDFYEGYSVAFKGGSNSYPKEQLAVSDRYLASNTNGNGFQYRAGDSGGRGVSRRQ